MALLLTLLGAQGMPVYKYHFSPNPALKRAPSPQQFVSSAPRRLLLALGTQSPLGT